ncbi:MAG: tetratricopeptide repeat protein [Pseudomonadota bacterium]
MRVFKIAMIACVGLIGAAHAAEAQDAAAAEDLRARQEALFRAMLETPDDLDLMFEHALTSIALKDYEAAITTLERMLIFNPGLGRAKVELGAAYFRLGAYESARFYFEDALASDDPPPEVARRINEFLSEIDRRTRTSGFSGVATFGVTFSTNANLGPDDADIGTPEVPIELDEEFVEDEDVGFRASLSGRHFYDLGQPDGDVWLTNLSLFSVHYVDETRGDLDTIAIRTGPRLSLDDASFGPKLRPFLRADAVRSDNDLLYGTLGVGAEYSETIREDLSLFLFGEGGWREYKDDDEFDGPTFRASVGAVYAATDVTSVSGLLFAETDRTEAGENRNVEFGARLGAAYRYDPGFDYADRLWSLSGFAGVAYRAFEDPNPDLPGSGPRDDVDLRVGVSHVFHLTDGFFVQAEADYLRRDSDVAAFDLENFGAALSIGLSF